VWNDDNAITHDPLRIRIINLTQPNLISSQLISVFTTSVTRERLGGIFEIWYGFYAIGHYLKRMLSNFLHSLMPL
jgi:hypothetical protein